MANLISYFVLITTVYVTLCSSSAIPMWEFLSRGEKMSHLYSMFAKQVSAHCKTNSAQIPVAQCKRDLLVYGVEHLEKMSDIHLDEMDPYQRGANDIIWDSMMEGHSSQSDRIDDTTLSTINKPNGQYQHNPLFDGSDSPVNTKDRTDSTYAMDMDYGFGQNSYPTGMEGSYVEPPNYLPKEAATNIDLQYDLPENSLTTNYLSGPMVVRVRPDGTPVDEDIVKPSDDDRDAMTIGKEKLPTAEQIVNEFQPSRTSIRSHRTTPRTIIN